MTTTNSTKSSSKIDRNALKAALASVTIAMGLKANSGGGKKLTDEERDARAAKKAAKLLVRLAPITESVKSGKHINSKTGKVHALNARRRIEMAFTLAQNNVPIPDAFFAAFPKLTDAADALVAAGALRKIDEAKVRAAFRLPGSVAVQVAPESGGAVIKIRKGRKAA